MIVVTGGAGFIGSNLVAGLEPQAAQPIVVCDHVGTGDKWRNLAKRTIADLIAPAQLFPWLDAHADELSTVFHMGAISATTASDGDAMVANNVRLSLDLWDWCARHGVRLIYASSAAVYGDGSNGFDDDPSLEAMAQLRPLNLYGWSKLVVDRAIAQRLALGTARPPQWCGLRFFNVYGPNEYHKGGQRSVVFTASGQIRETAACRLFKSYRDDIADGGQQRDFVWVDDCVAVMLWLHANPGTSGLFNLGTGKARSFADLAGAVFDAIGVPRRIDYVDMPPAVRAHYQYFTQAEMGRLRGAGYTRPFTPVEQGVRHYVQDYLMREDPYR